MKHRIIVLAACLLALTTVVTFAWMDEDNPAVGSSIWMAFGQSTNNKYTIGVESNELLTEFYVKNADGEYEKVFSAEQDESSTAFFDVENFKPSDVIEFKFVFTNMGSSNIFANIFFSDITSEDINAETEMPKLSEVFYISLTGSEGYSEYSLDRPDTSFERLGDIMTTMGDREDSWEMPFVRNILIPPTTYTQDETAGEAEIGEDDMGQSPITIYGYLLFDRNSSNEYEGCGMRMGSILISM